MELTKEYFDQTISNLVSGMVSQKSFDETISSLVSGVVSHEYFDQTITEIKSLVIIIKDEMGGLATKSELFSIKIDLAELKEQMEKIDKRDKEDSDFFKKLLIEHGRRIVKLEKSKA